MTGAHAFPDSSTDGGYLTLVLPSRNDVRHLRKILQTILEARIRIRVTLVDSGSRTINHSYMRTVVEEFVNEGLDITLILAKAGIGNALSAGFKNAKTLAVAWFPTDGQLPLSVLERICDIEKQSSALIIVRVNYEQVSGVLRRALTAWNYLLIKVLLGIDIRQFNGAFVMPAEVVTQLPMKFHTAAMNWAILHSAISKGLDIEKVSAIVKQRDVGRSRITKSELLRYPVELARYAWISRSGDLSTRR